MPETAVPLKLPQQRRFMQTLRKDTWWVPGLLTLIVFSAFIVYATFRVFEGTAYHFAGADSRGLHANYLSPFYSPLAFDTPAAQGGPATPSHHAWTQQKPAWLPAFVSAAALVLIFPAGFRFTCYYYRGAYYKAFWADPPSCAVGEPRSNYLGENSLPLILQNIHRYFMYAALVFIVILSYDAVVAFKFYTDETHTKWQFGIGVGTLVLTINAILLAGYTCGCHSLRHLVGGFMDEMSKSPLRKKTYDCVSCLNRKHMVWAWVSLFWVAFTDVYVRMCALGYWTDFRLL